MVWSNFEPAESSRARKPITACMYSSKLPKEDVGVLMSCSDYKALTSAYRYRESLCEFLKLYIEEDVS